MQYKKIMAVKPLTFLLSLCSFLLCSCYNDDTTSRPSESDTTGVVIQNTDPSSTFMAQAESTDTVAKSDGVATAKPNPAKKGMKGKVTVMESPKMSGAMEADKSGTYTNVEVYPSFPGGSKGLQSYFDKNLQYPADASNDGVEGTVNILFTVDETGKLSNAHVSGNKLGYGLDEEALRVVNSMPAWNPGKLKGKNVKTKFTLPVSFQLL